MFRIPGHVECSGSNVKRIYMVYKRISHRDVAPRVPEGQTNTLVFISLFILFRNSEVVRGAWGYGVRGVRGEYAPYACYHKRIARMPGGVP